MIYGIMLLAIGCSPGGESGSLSSPMPSVPQLEQQAIANMLELYRQAVLQEDVDRLQTLVQPESTATLLAETPTFLTTLGEHFRAVNVTAFHIPAETVQVAADRRSMSFLEIESAIHPDPPVQHTQLFHTTVQIVPQETDGVVTLRMHRLQRSVAPLVRVSTPGQIQAGALTRIEVTGSDAPFDIAEVRMGGPEPESGESLTRNDRHFYGVFTPLDAPGLQVLPVYLRSVTGETMVLQHHYSVRRRGEGVLQRLEGTGATPLTSVVVASDGTVWAGGEDGATLYVVPPGSDTVAIKRVFLLHPRARVEDVSMDALGRLHVLVLDSDGERVMGQRVQVYDPGHDRFCSTVDVFSPAYPFRNLQGQRSASTRLRAADDGNIWLFGSDGGVGRVRDTFRRGLCLAGEAAVSYDLPIFQRAAGALPASVVPALAISPDGAMWFGSIFGVSRLLDGQWTAAPFHPTLSLQGSVDTLERFFHQLAAAIFAAEPVLTVKLGEVSFVDEFQRPVIKEDLSWSMAVDNKGRVWVGTLGGGIRVMAAQGAQVRDLWHLTRTEVVRIDPEDGHRIVIGQEGVSSNLILALLAGTDDTMWAATDEGVSRIQEQDGAFSIKQFSRLDGLVLPVRDLAIDPQDRVWLATEGGLWRMLRAGGVIQGEVLDFAGNPVVGADVLIVGTPWRAVTDAAGRFRIANMPPGPHHLQVDGALAAGGPFGLTEQSVVVITGEQTLAQPLHLLRRGERQLVRDAGNPQSGFVGATLSLAVALLDADGHGALNVPLTFTLSPGNNGSITPDQPVLTDAEGRAAIMLTLGARATVNQVTVTTPEEPASRLSLVLSVTGLPEHSSARLLSVSGNNQSAQVQESLPLPLVVRLEDQFRNALIGIEVTATIQQGAGEISPFSSSPLRSNARDSAVSRTDTNGEARFQLQVRDNQRDVLVEIAVTAPEPDLQNVQPVRFLTIVGTVDIAGLPSDLAVKGQVAYVASGLAGLQVIDISDIRKPQVKATIETLTVDGAEVRPSFLNVAIDGTSAYVATAAPVTFTRFDMTNPTQPDPPFVLDTVYQASRPVKIVLDGNLAYLVLVNPSTNAGSLHIFDLSTPSLPRQQGVINLPHLLRGLVVVDQFAYIPVTPFGMRVVDVRDPQAPKLSTTVLEPNISVHSMSNVGKTVYAIETRDNQLYFSVFDGSEPGVLRRRGSLLSHASAAPFASAAIAVAEPFAYVASFDLGLQVFDIGLDQPTLVARLATPSVANAAATRATARTLIHVADPAIGLSIVLGPPHQDRDTDGDGVGNFFDEFPFDAMETMDTDRDGTGNTADPDDDNDGVSDKVENDPRLDPIYPEGLAPTDSLNPKDFPVACGRLEDHTLHVDAAAAPHGDGSPAAPYHSIRTALKAAAACLRNPQVQGRIIVSVRPGIYSALRTMESFPLRLTDDRVDLVGAGHMGTPGKPLPRCNAIPPPQPAQATIVDATFFANVLDIVVGGSTVEGLVLQHGINGITIGAPFSSSEAITLQHLRVAENLNTGVAAGSFPVSLVGNYVVGNGFRGLDIDRTIATVTGNTVHCNGEDGIFFFLGAAGHIDRNLVVNNAQDGIQIHLFSSVQTVRENEILANGRQGLLVSTASEATAMDNVIADNGEAGIRVSFISTATLSGNQVLRNFDGIQVLEQARAQIREGKITRNANHGIFIHDNAGKVEIACSGNPLIISSNQNDGIHITSDSLAAAMDRDNILFKNNGDADIQGQATICPGVP